MFVCVLGVVLFVKNVRFCVLCHVSDVSYVIGMWCAEGENVKCANVDVYVCVLDA